MKQIKVTSGKPIAKFCQGYLIQKPDSMEVLYAVLDGRVLESDTHRYSVHFNKPGRIWTRVAELPEGAEFIGNYPFPGSKS